MNNKPEHQEKQIVYVDMDNVLVDFPSAVDRLPQETFEKYKGHYDEVPGIFATMEPMKGALEAYRYLAEHFDVYILSTAPWRNPSAWSDKLLWVQRYLGDVAYKRLILTHHKDLNRGDYLIDDRTRNGADQFQGKLIQFGTETFPDWAAVVRYFETVVWLQQIELPLSDEDYVALREEELKTNGEVWKIASPELRDSYEDLMLWWWGKYQPRGTDAEIDDIIDLGMWYPPKTEKYKDYPNYHQAGRVRRRDWDTAQETNTMYYEEIMSYAPKDCQPTRLTEQTVYEAYAKRHGKPVKDLTESDKEKAWKEWDEATDDPLDAYRG